MAIWLSLGYKLSSRFYKLTIYKALAPISHNYPSIRSTRTLNASLYRLILVVVFHLAYIFRIVFGISNVMSILELIVSVA